MNTMPNGRWARIGANCVLGGTRHCCGAHICILKSEIPTVCKQVARHVPVAISPDYWGTTASKLRTRRLLLGRYIRGTRGKSAHSAREFWYGPMDFKARDIACTRFGKSADSDPHAPLGLCDFVCVARKLLSVLGAVLLANCWKT